MNEELIQHLRDENEDGLTGQTALTAVCHVMSADEDNLSVVTISQDVMWRSVLTVTLLCCSSEASVTCRDESDNEVDWFILYKAPKNVQRTNQPTTTGLEYMYIYPHGSQIASTRNQKPINDPTGVLANTLRPLFKDKNLMPQDFGFISYSDQPPEKNAGHTFGHSKGVVMLDRTNTGVWLLHSTPRFPYKRDQNFWPPTGHKNAQTFICVTFPYGEFEKIGKHLQYIKANPFDHHIPPDFIDELQKVVNKNGVAPSSFSHVLTSAEVKSFVASQNNYWLVIGDADLYVVILKAANSAVKVQSWGCQHGRIKGIWDVGGKTVENTVCLKTEFGNWKPTKDHSKWCVTTDQNRPWTCIADVNRSESQFERPGGALCIRNEAITNIFKGFMGTVGDCVAENEVGGAAKADSDTECDSDTDPEGNAK
ncbi:hypothetical protein Q5P01_003086 [Channa striata]|uniref:Deoxyribonuclease-2-alpha n=1 Tax=Channa striata TaxID=64152 RepID=A0AA88T6V2_CHASR|nr:hypothetical protein Q5P01_003086 [Channa striata]